MGKIIRSETTLLIAEDDDGHAELIIDNLREAGFNNEIIRFQDGQQLIDFITNKSETAKAALTGDSYLLLLDIRMPKVDGVEVLRKIKSLPELKKMPVIMLTTTDDPKEINKCYELGCNFYITKPVDYNRFSEMLNRLALFLMVVQLPDFKGKV